MATEAKSTSPDKDQQKQAAPSISLPRGGGAIRGIGEKFAANPVTGTGSMSMPIAASPGRGGFGPQLSLSYDSGAGNGPFGFGWSLSLPSITRKTVKGLPQYFDATESDIFILSGAEDLVPELQPDGSRFEDTMTDPAYTIHRYRPRVEGLFTRIERWTLRENGDIHWRSISRDNILTLYGKDPDSRIADPGDSRHIFSWLICETRDDKGNAVLYEYKREDGAGVVLTQAHERNRGSRDDPRRTANRYLKHIRYGNRAPLLDSAGQRPRMLTDAQIDGAGWMFEVVFDYGEHDADTPSAVEAGEWTYRNDPFSNYHAGFEVRTTRLCQRMLMFHHFPDEAETGNDCLVRSTDFAYSHEEDPTSARNPVYTFLLAATQNGYKRRNGGYLKRGLPPVEFEYTQPVVQDTVHGVDAASLENLPIGVDGTAYQWIDLHGEGIPGILTEQADAWFYKRNISPISDHPVEFAPLERVAVKPNAGITVRVGVGVAGRGAQSLAQFMDLAGDGQPDLVVMGDPTPGLYEHDGGEGWQPFRPFTSRLYRDMGDPNLKFVDLDGDGHADVLISENEAFVWHASFAEEGFGPARRVQQTLDEEKGPRLVFADGTQSIYLADMSGDGLTDLVRIRNGEVCYWPNLGYCRFGAKIAMDRAPHFDRQDQFDHKRMRLADIDGTGTTDIIYLHRDGVRLYFNQSGNSWGQPQALRVFPRVDDLVSMTPADLLGNGTACLVWSSPLPGDARRQMRYVDLMGGQKPHLLVKSVNNLGAETRIRYAPSTRFYLQDKRDGKPWITRLPFPVHVVDRVETYDHISHNRFVTRHAYHHGYFDGKEREFHGFGMVEQWDTEEFAALGASDAFLTSDNIDMASHVPPVHTKTWFHTGVYLGRAHISDFFAGLLDMHDQGEYYREPGLTDPQAREMLLDDTVLPQGLTVEEEREACRALKGSMLRQEVYALDGTAQAQHPYMVAEQNFNVEVLQHRGENRYAVFFTHAREAISYHYERNPGDPRIAHTLTLEVDAFGNVLKQAAIANGRRQPDMALSVADSARQTQILITYTENKVANAIEGVDDYRTPLPTETRTFELTGVPAPVEHGRYTLMETLTAGTGAATIPYEASPTSGLLQRRLIEHVRTRYRPNDLGAAQNDLLALLPLGVVESLALPGESYKLAFTPGLITQVYGNRVDDTLLETEGRYVHSEDDGNWWTPSGRVFLSPGANDTPQTELLHAHQHFFLPHRFRDPFHTDAVSTESFVSYDPYDLVMLESRDALGNMFTVATQDDAGNTAIRIDYRVLQPFWITDPNGNRTQVAFDALGMVVGTAAMGKPPPAPVEGDSLEGFGPDLTGETVLAHLEAPLTEPHAILQGATTRLVYDLFAYFRTKELTNPQPATIYTLARETHDADLATGVQTRIQHSFSYSDGFGREIQKKIQAESGPVPRRNDNGEIIVGADGQPEMTANDVTPRWVGSGWTVFNNKGKPVRQYEPYFTDTHRFEFDVRIGISPVIFYDPVGRVVATLHPNHTWEKVIFDSWRRENWDVNDTALITNPADDTDVGGFFSRLPETEYLPTWHTRRIAGQFGESPAQRQAEQRAAHKAAAHAETPAIAHFDTLGRAFLTLADNGPDPAQPGQHLLFASRVELDIEGNHRAVRDAIVQAGDPLGRIVTRYDHDMLGTQIHSVSMEAGERWMLNDVAGKPVRAWDSRGHAFRFDYDALRRPVRSFVQGSDPQNPMSEILFGRTEYGEGQANDAVLNLRTRAFQVFDTAGIATSVEYDFKGNLLSGNRQLVSDYRVSPDWSGNPPLDPDIFTSSTTHDALNRPLILTTPDNSVVRPGYNEANLLERMAVNLRGSATTTEFVRDIHYNAKGQRESIEFGNGVRTRYEYDPLAFRLMRLRTLRGTTALQDLSYVYDPAGNITSLRDDAQQTIYFNNAIVEPHADYTYDAIYRLIAATGREHIGQLTQPQTSWNDEDRTRLAHPHDGQAMRRYAEEYEYDGVGNFLRLIHQATNGNWTRNYAYEEVSLIEPGKQSNRLSRASVGVANETYTHDGHGNMTSMPHLPLMRWDFKDQLQASTRQVVNEETPQTTYYVYDATGQRVRKVTERQAAAGEIPARMHERIYLHGFEVYREYENDGTTMALEREALHIMDDQERIALAETRTQGDDGSPAQLLRYQYGNHLGSACLELDADAAVISYEEYHPYGSTAYQGGRSMAEVSLKRYRYTGKERDEETGLSYHGARYLATWLGRWTAADPIGLKDGMNLYGYVLSNPVAFSDPTGTQGSWYNRFEEAVTLVEDKAYVLGESLESVASTVEEGADLALREATDFTVETAASAANAVGIEVSEETKAIAKTEIEMGAGLALSGPTGALNVAASVASSVLQAPKNLDASIQITAQGVETGNAERIVAGIGGMIEHGGTIADALVGGASTKKSVRLALEASQQAANAARVTKKTTRSAPKPEGTAVAASSERKQRFSEMAEGDAAAGATRYRSRDIKQELKHSEIGKETRDLITQHKLKIELNATKIPPPGVLGEHLPDTDTVTIFTENVRTVRKAAETVIHEVTHAIGIRGTQRAEVIAEIRAAKHAGNVAASEIRGIIDWAKRTYSHLPWM